MTNPDPKITSSDINTQCFKNVADHFEKTNKFKDQFRKLNLL